MQTLDYEEQKTEGGMGSAVSYLQSLVDKGGPEIEDYYELDAWLAELWEKVKFGRIGDAELASLHAILGDAISTATMQGFVYLKPHGYAGDYEIIDRIYRRYVSEDDRLSKWDIYAQQHACALAVRNRVDYFCRVLEKTPPPPGRRLEVLNLASGPGRDMLQFFSDNPRANVHIDCVEQDSAAVGHAKGLCAAYLDRISFHMTNALKLQTFKKYDLIWSAGLFDYFNDRVFEFMLKRLAPMVAEGGEIVIGNFSPLNPSRPYMEIFEWHLHHRSPNALRALATKAGFNASQISVRKEPAGVNLFLHISAR